MQYTVPHYYKKFRCIAGECPDTCCAGWQIQIDPASLRKYRKIKGPLGNRLKNEINWKESCFRQYNGRCAFLNENDLCDLYLEGEGTRAFCRTCRTYPRHIEEFEGLREISLSLSCPAAADLILNCGEPVRFLHAEDEKEDEPYEDFDFFLFTKLEDARSLILRILQDRAHPFSLRAAASLALAYDLQQRIDKNALFEADSLFDRYSSPGMWTWFEARFSALELSEDHTEKRNSTENALFSILDRLEVLRDDWMPYLVDARRTLKNAPALQKEEERSFSDLFTEQTAEQLLVYFVFT
ncbi:MAG TPA: flagellin lysine-N-methylase, partial [Candidatus Mediterraneibacter stercoravium]|nr:flagellin lysine-N-methylase [Candidatus Mediterraneibacter stercoravium]